MDLMLLKVDNYPNYKARGSYTVYNILLIELCHIFCAIYISPKPLDIIAQYLNCGV